jgi:hypothetical protein
MSVLTRPDTIVYTITNGTIAWSPKEGTVGAHPGGKVHFRIDNSDDNISYDVSIPLNKFEPRRPAPRDPIDEPASGGKNTVNLPPHSTRELVYMIKPRSHFHFVEDKVDVYTYKYTLYYKNASTGVDTPVDPDLEVSP